MYKDIDVSSHNNMIVLLLVDLKIYRTIIIKTISDESTNNIKLIYINTIRKLPQNITYPLKK
jgi:hypothetical protein